MGKVYPPGDLFENLFIIDKKNLHRVAFLVRHPINKQFSCLISFSSVLTGCFSTLKKFMNVNKSIAKFLLNKLNFK